MCSHCSEEHKEESMTSLSLRSQVHVRLKVWLLKLSLFSRQMSNQVIHASALQHPPIHFNFNCFVSLPALPEFLLGSSLPCWRPSPPPTSSSHGRWRRHAQWAVRHAAACRPAGRWGENNTLAQTWWHARIHAYVLTSYAYKSETQVHYKETLKWQILKFMTNKQIVRNYSTLTKQNSAF